MELKQTPHSTTVRAKSSFSELSIRSRFVRPRSCEAVKNRFESVPFFVLPRRTGPRRISQRENGPKWMIRIKFDLVLEFISFAHSGLIFFLKLFNYIFFFLCVRQCLGILDNNFQNKNKILFENQNIRI